MPKYLLMALAIATIAVTAFCFSPIVSAEQGGAYDEYGYNYTAKCFNGYYENFSRPPAPVSSSDWHLSMKWNDAWMNKDKVRHEGYSSYRGSGAWLTNHIRSLTDDKETYFVKIVAAPTDWTLVGAGTGGTWYDADNNEMGESIWGEFYIAQEVLSGAGLSLKAPAGPGLGNN